MGREVVLHGGHLDFSIHSRDSEGHEWILPVRLIHHQRHGERQHSAQHRHGDLSPHHAGSEPAEPDHAADPEVGGEAGPAGVSLPDPLLTRTSQYNLTLKKKSIFYISYNGPFTSPLVHQRFLANAATL